MAPKKDVKQGDEEAVPLLKKEDDQNPLSALGAKLAMGGSEETPQQAAKSKMRVVNYETKRLATFSALTHLSGTVWTNRALWKNMGALFGVSLLFAFFLWLLVPDPGSVDASKFAAISNFLKVFLAFLLGFFMASSVGRWTTTVKGFLGLFNAVRNMCMQMHALGVQNEKIDHVVRYGIVSCVFLVSELEMAVDSPAIKQAKSEMMWLHLKQKGLLTDGEAPVLEPLEDRASLIWIWVASKIGRYAQDGDIPPMNSGTYGRIMALCQSAQDGIRQVRSSISVQIPFIYTHMLACLVHLNNVLCALTFGLTLGSGMGAILSHHGIHSPMVTYVYAKHTTTAAPDEANFYALHAAGKQNPSGAGQAIFLSMFTCLVAPFMYQAFLQIALALAQPFGSEEAAIPTDALIMKLRADLEHMERMSDNTPGWEKPVFKS